MTNDKGVITRAIEALKDSVSTYASINATGYSLNPAMQEKALKDLQAFKDAVPEGLKQSSNTGYCTYANNTVEYDEGDFEKVIKAAQLLEKGTR